MRVKSDLADLDIKLGRISRQGDKLVVDSAPESSLDARIRVDASEARSMLGKVLKSGAVWGFLLRLPFSRPARATGTPRGRGRAALNEVGDLSAARSPDNPAWRERRESTGLNKPW
ncbi:MAG: hypothetical protein F4Y31_06180 [Gammaproteobacteria bacterium]|nr:hypothetical protein [Gammaproteobacteria bacterium]MYF68316.1 hypothetical protein [Gammaproteobacteria bacterium]MYK38077.1 hypothetical protein [Gammaproteobacteria bacterium]